MTVGDTYQLIVTVEPNTISPAITYTSNNTSVATVSDSGLISAEAIGSATITVTIEGYDSELVCGIAVENPVTSASLNATSHTLNVGEQFQLTCTTYPESAPATISWSSNNTSVATVDDNGLVTALKEGEATISVSIAEYDGTVTPCVIKVENPVTGAALNKTELSLEIDGTEQLSCTITPSDANADITWKSSDESVATVDQTGLVTAIDEGTATISAAIDGYSGTIDPCTVTVTQPEITASLTLYSSPDLTESIDSVVELSGAYPLFVSLDGIPSSKSITDYTFSWPETTSGYVLSDYAVDSKTYNRFFTPSSDGDCTVEVGVYSAKGTYVATASIDITITPNYDNYTIISTAEDFISKVLASTSAADKFALGANIDLAGIDTDGANNNVTFQGILDGRGYTVRNFNANPNSSGLNGGLWYNVGSTAIIRNTHFIGTMNQTAGFGGLLCRELYGTVTDCIFECTSTVDTSSLNWVWCRSGIVAGILYGDITNCVVENTDNNAQVLDTAPYAGGDIYGYTKIIDNVYTKNSYTETNQHVVPFTPETADWWGEANISNMHDSQVWTNNKASDYDLDGDYWDITDYEFPALVHDDEAFVTLEPEVEVSSTATSLTVGGDAATVTLTASNFSGDITYSYSYETENVVEVTNNNDSTFTVNPVGEGDVTVTFTASSGEQTASASVDFTVATSSTGGESGGEGTGETYTIPDNAYEIKDLDTFNTYFNGSATYYNVNAYLSADIDLTGTTFDSIRMAGDYTATFEGCGHTISGYSQTGGSLFTIISGEVRNLNLVCSDWSASGYGVLSNSNAAAGTISNVNVDVTVTTGINTWGAITYLNSGTISDCHADIHLTAAAASSNTIYHIAKDESGTFTNCTYTVDGEGASVTFNTDPDGVTEYSSGSDTEEGEGTTGGETGGSESYTIPDNAYEIKDLDTFNTYFNGSATYYNVNAYLSADIDLTGTTFDSIRMAGDYTATFEGCGHTISGYSQTGGSLFTIISGEVRNLNLVCSDWSASGYGVLSNSNAAAGTISNVNVDVTVTTGINTWGAITYLNSGTISDCHADIHLTAAAASSNTIYHIAKDESGTFTNCTYTVDGEGASVTFNTDPDGVTQA